MGDIKLFMEKVRTDAALQKKFMAMQDKGKEEALEAIVALAQESGFEICKEDLMAYIQAINENAELNEMELDAVAGGGAVDWIAATVMSLGILCAATVAGKVLINYCGLN